MGQYWEIINVDSLESTSLGKYGEFFYEGLGNMLERILVPPNQSTLNTVLGECQYACRGAGRAHVSYAYETTRRTCESGFLPVKILRASKKYKRPLHLLTQKENLRWWRLFTALPAKRVMLGTGIRWVLRNLTKKVIRPVEWDTG
jgi:hypothetical protein